MREPLVASWFVSILSSAAELRTSSKMVFNNWITVSFHFNRFIRFNNIMQRPALNAMCLFCL